MRIKHTKKIAGLILLILAAFASFEFIRIRQTILNILSEEHALLKDRSAVRFERTALTPLDPEGIQIWQSFEDTRDVAEYKGSLFAATSGGLVQYSGDGQVKRHFTVLDGLPESDLTALGTFRGKLYIGTRSEGLVEFDGSKFFKYTWPGRDAQTVTAILNDSEKRLLIGTFNGGLLEFKGGSFEELLPGGERAAKVTALGIFRGRLSVATFDDGLWIQEGAVWTHLGKEQGLPSERVTGITDDGRKIAAATDLGIALCEARSCTASALLPALTGISRNGEDFYVSRDSGEIYKVEKAVSLIDELKEPSEGFRFASAGDKRFLVGKTGIFEVRGSRLVRFGNAPSKGSGSNFSSALFVSKGLVWSGRFRDGIDIFTTAGRFVKHIQSEGLREINNISEGKGGSVRAATTDGVYDISGVFEVSEEKGGREFDGTAVSQVYGNTIATSRGLVLDADKGGRVLTAENGLPSNSVYTVLDANGSRYAGTLGGLAQIKNGRVAEVWKDSNSGLSTNWVTALAFARSRIFIGTYGGGIYELLPSGKVHSFAPETGKFTVNFNALTTDGERLYAGTLDGLRVLDLSTQKWETVRRGLPSQTVMSVASADGRLFAATSSGIAIYETEALRREETKQ